MPHQRQLVAIMFTDIQGYTAMMQHDEELAVKIRDRIEKRKIGRRRKKSCSEGSSGCSVCSRAANWGRRIRRQPISSNAFIPGDRTREGHVTYSRDMTIGANAAMLLVP